MPMSPYQAQQSTHFGQPGVDPKTMMMVAQMLRQQNPQLGGQPPQAPAAPPIQRTAPSMASRPPMPQGPPPMATPQGPPQGPPEPAQGPPQSQNMMAGGGAGTDIPTAFDNMSPQVAQSLMGLGDKDRQMKYAEKLRDRGPLEGTKFKNSVGGETFVGSGPGAFALRAYENFRNKKNIDKLGKEQTQGRMNILDLLRGTKRDSAAADQGSTPMAEGDGM